MTAKRIILTGFLLFIVTLAGAVIVLTPLARRTHAQEAEGPFLLLFSSNVSGNYDVYQRELSTGLINPLTSSTFNEIEPTLSPDGQWIAYSSDEDGDYDIYLMPIDSFSAVKLTDNTVDDRYPTWLSSGALLYASQGDAAWDWTAIPMTNGITRPAIPLTQGGQPLQPDLTELDPATLLPIVFSDDPDGNFDLFWFNLASGAFEALTTTPANEIEPAVSPDGQWVVYTSDEGGDFVLFLRSLTDGSEPVQLTESGQIARLGSWVGLDSVMYASLIDGNWDLFLIAVEDGSITRLTDDAAAEVGPDIAEGGSEVVSSGTPDATVNSDRLNIRANPGTGAAVVGVVDRDAALQVIGQLADGSWLQVVSADGIRGWAFADLLVVNIDLAGVPIVNASVVNPAQPTTAAATPVPTQSGGGGGGGENPPPQPTSPPPPPPTSGPPETPES